ncbi:MAG: hypothetical protein N4A44_04445 [Alphaproteobacteria bacterium]|jgi:hypothetical protein|nr:hypothetical protein [Alphaproteobacteria bacterium]
MINNKYLNDILSELPLNLKTNIDGYMRSIENSLDEIFLPFINNSKKNINKEIVDKFLFLILLRKIKATIKTQILILSNSLSISNKDIKNNFGFQTGKKIYSKSSKEFKELSKLEMEFDSLILKLDLNHYIYSSSPSNLLEILYEEL